jgi:dihydrofolate reductase
MARFVMGMNVSLDGFVDHDRMAPDSTLFRYWIDAVKQTETVLYGRKVYELMRYWEPDQPGWGDAEHEFAQAWRAQKKWVVSRSLTGVGPNATLISDDIEATIRALKTRHPGQVDVSGTILAQSLADWGLMDEYQLCIHPVTLGSGKPFFASPRPRLQFLGSDMVSESVIRLRYAPA